MSKEPEKELEPHRCPCSAGSRHADNPATSAREPAEEAEPTTESAEALEEALWRDWLLRLEGAVAVMRSDFFWKYGYVQVNGEVHGPAVHGPAVE
jgi:hypothetical protein